MMALLLNHLWQSSLCVGGAGLLALAMQRNGANVRFWLWFAASVKFLVPFAALTMLGASFLTPIVPPVTAPAITLMQRLAKPFSAPVTAIAVPMSEPRAKPVSAPPPALTVTVMEPRAKPFSAPAPVLTTANTAPAAARLDLGSVLLVLWIAGFLIITLRWLVRWSRVRVLVREAVEVQVGAPIAVKFSASRLEPGLVGILRPVILLPQGIKQQLSPAELQAVLAHELCHWRRHDNLLATIHMLVEALFWFFPLVWWLGARLNAERERACDESVLADGNDPQMYAEGILKVCRAYLQSPLPCVAGISGAGLKKRMETIMENRLIVKLNAARKFVLSASAAIALALPLALGLAAAPVAQTQAKAAAIPSLLLTIPQRVSVSAEPAPAPEISMAALPPQPVAKNPVERPARRANETTTANADTALTETTPSAQPESALPPSPVVPSLPNQSVVVTRVAEVTAPPAAPGQKLPSGADDPDALTCNAPQLVPLAKVAGRDVCAQNSIVATLSETSEPSLGGKPIRSYSDLPISRQPTGEGDVGAVACWEGARDRTGSRTQGPIACAHNDFWAKLNERGCILSPNARGIIQSGTTKNLDPLACTNIPGRNGRLPPNFF
jgi:beta-lactamase regulating signal transducer with metallopeptidase domain